jgi:LmbE family N-acetylglucosaminyl deacetylase
VLNSDLGSKSKYLFIGAHPDDIEFGAGATIAKAISLGIDCHTLVLSDCQETLGSSGGAGLSLIEESTNALSELGVPAKNMSWYQFPVRRFTESRQDILSLLIEDFRGRGWDRVYIPNMDDIHQDHSVVNIEAVRAFKFTTVLGYELPWNNLKLNVSTFNLVSEVEVQKKVSAIKKFVSQTNRFYASEDKIRTVLRFRGLQVNSEHAEAFETIRCMEN